MDKAQGYIVAPTGVIILVGLVIIFGAIIFFTHRRATSKYKDMPEHTYSPQNIEIPASDQPTPAAAHHVAAPAVRKPAAQSHSTPSLHHKQYKPHLAPHPMLHKQGASPKVTPTPVITQSPAPHKTRTINDVVRPRGTSSSSKLAAQSKRSTVSLNRHPLISPAKQGRLVQL